MALIFGRSLDDIIINAVRERPYLYVSSRRDYRDSVKREKAFRAIGESVGLKGDVVAKRWKALRDRFNKERKIILEKTKSGAPPGMTSRWKWYKMLLFLEDHVRPRSSSVDLEYSDCQYVGENENEETPERGPATELLELILSPPSEDEVDVTDSKSPATNKDSVDDASTLSRSSTSSLTEPPAKKRLHNTNQVTNMVHAIPTGAQQISDLASMDGEMAFGVNVGHRLKALTPRQSKLAQLKIQEVLFNVEYGSSDS